MLSHGGTERELSRGQTSPRRTGSVADLDPRPFDPVREGPSKADLNRADRIHSLELEVENLKEEQKKHKRHDARLVIGSSVATAALVVGGQALLSKVFADEPTPATRDISSVGPTSFNNETLQSTEKFDNSAEKGKVGKNTLTDRSLSEIKDGLQNIPNQNATTIAMTWPIEFEDGETIKYERPKSLWQPTEELRVQVEKDGVKPEIIFKLNKGDIFKAPLFIYNGDLPTEYRGMIMQNSPDLGADDTTMTGNGRLFLYYKNSNTTVVAWFFCEGLTEADHNLIPLIPMRGNENWNGLGWKNFPMIEPNTGMAQATKDNQVVKFTLEAFPGQNIGSIPELVDKTAFRITPNFLPDENGTITNLQP